MPTAVEPRGTAALLVNQRGEYLLHLRDAHKKICDPGTWSVPGGAREGTETLDEAIARELKEETGLTIADLCRFTVVECTGPDGITKGHIQVYLGHWDGDASALPVTEGIMFHHFAASSTEQLTMSPWAADVIAQHQAHTAVHRLSAAPTAAAPAPGGQTVLNVIGVHLYLERDGTVLLGLRHPDSAYAGSTHHFLAGHCEQESAVACLIREAREEAGLRIEADDVEFVHAVHLIDEPGTQPRLQMVFRARRWEGRPEVREPDKCVSWDWWPVGALPEPVVPYTRAAIEGIRAGRLYTEMGWT
ncbi:NUDIX domain-containing protein [Streptomyces sp. NBC_01142]|uniref:NUDIX hydrolase n=1 Tax=Streptomyces sp. NBC_01142 TaxID=2975865 RepID=UPI002256F6F5|nr:NUDIX domain-containing protein [Streptomyces sp. NBC_01142]MCX4821343.1 NUDIX domain-containing protein [Streptomyces sp. NBC_01142]